MEHGKLSLAEKLIVLRSKDISRVNIDSINQMDLFKVQKIRETKETTTTVRVDVDLMSRIKRLARENGIKNHGKLMNMLLDELLNNLETH